MRTIYSKYTDKEILEIFASRRETFFKEQHKFNEMIDELEIRLKKVSTGCNEIQNWIEE